MMRWREKEKRREEKRREIQREIMTKRKIRMISELRKWAELRERVMTKLKKENSHDMIIIG